MEKRPVYFLFLKEKSISKIQKEPSEQCVLCTEATCEQPTFQPLPFRLQEMKRKFSTKTPNSVTFQNSNKDLKQFWKGRLSQRKTRPTHKITKLIKQLACSNSEFYHQYMWRRSNYVHKTQGIPEITWKKIFLLNPLHCYRLKPIIFQIHIEEWPLTRCFTTSWVRVLLSYCFFVYYLLVIFSFSCGLHDDDSKQCMGMKIKSEE